MHNILSRIMGLVVGTVLASSSGYAQNHTVSKVAPDQAKSATTSPSLEEPLNGRRGRPLALDLFRPRPMLQVPCHHLTRAKFPVVDIHTHPRLRLHHSSEQLDAFVELMNQQNIAICVSLDGRLAENFHEHADYLWDKHLMRFVIFANIDWQGDGQTEEPATWDCHRPDFGRRMAKALGEAKLQGVSGLKIFKQLGLGYRNPDGSWISIDDPRWDPIWEACGQLGLPVLIHTADPAAFFLPVDETNERWEELNRHPEWSFFGNSFPSRNSLLAARNRVIARHPKTLFIGAHVANNPEDLHTVGIWLEKYPNLYVGIASRIAELGRQPYTARRFFLRYSDRILFGTDGPRTGDRLYLHWRFLETYDEFFPYAENPFPPQGMWNIYGLGLPDEVLRKIYYQNAARIIPSVREKFDSYSQPHP